LARCPDGTKVEAVTLTNGAGMSAKIMTLGATLQSLIVPDKAGRKEDVVLGYDTAPGISHPAELFRRLGRGAMPTASPKANSRWMARTSPRHQ
jgi:aldose 1-epimerase